MGIYGGHFRISIYFWEAGKKVKPFGFHGIRHLTVSILYQKGYPLSVIQTILRHASPNTTARYIHSLGLEETRRALEEGLKEPGQVIEFNKESVA